MLKMRLESPRMNERIQAEMQIIKKEIDCTFAW